MHDLIDEREFVIEPPYNPWPFFYVCYAVAIFVSSFAYIIRRLGLEVTDLIVLASCHLLVMAVLSIIVIFGKKKISLLSGWTLAKGLGGLIMVYYICYVLVTFFSYLTSEYFEPEIMSDFLYPMILYFIIYLIIVAILIPLALRRRKKLRNSRK